MLTDLLAHRFADDPKAADVLEDENFDLQAQLNAINDEAEAEALGAAGSDDWEDLTPQ
jgi:hypothetical protein